MIGVYRGAFINICVVIGALILQYVMTRNDCSHEFCISVSFRFFTSLI